MLRFFLFISLVFSFCWACQNPQTEPVNSSNENIATPISTSTFEGEVKAIEAANQLFEAIGGKEKWAELQCPKNTLWFCNLFF